MVVVLSAAESTSAPGLEPAVAYEARHGGQMSAGRLVVGQSKAHFSFFVSMAVALAAIGVAVVNRPLAQSYPGGLFILAIFAVVGVHIFSSRLVLAGDIYRCGAMGERSGKSTSATLSLLHITTMPDGLHGASAGGDRSSVRSRQSCSTRVNWRR